MITMTGGTIVGDTALSTMAVGASLFGGKQDIRCVATVFGIVTSRTSNLEMFSMSKSGANQPAVGNDWFGYVRHLGS